MFILLEVSDGNKIDIVAHDDATASTVREVCRCATLADVANAVDAEEVKNIRRRTALVPPYDELKSHPEGWSDSDDDDPDEPTPLAIGPSESD